MTFIQMTSAHYPAVREIYLQGIATGNATFQTSAPEWETWDQEHLAYCRIVAVQDNVVIGWAALTPVSGRCVYAGVAEVSVYVNDHARGKGTGKKLLQQLILESEQHQIWTLQAGIFPENTASIHLHKSLGFREVGYREKIGKMNGRWRDTLLFERRSRQTGVDE
ncbi:MAG: GNAT family N-acetyltransferase [Chitinophagales bacterium]|nr:GNAT family N-acetyltransferase [Chitinophagales bacterium]